jgi:hypothetical protein
MSLSSAKRKSVAELRTSGEQAAHFAFRRSGFVREYENERKGSTVAQGDCDQMSPKSFGIFD